MSVSFKNQIAAMLGALAPRTGLDVRIEESWSRSRPNRWLVERSSTASDWRKISRVLVLNLSGKQTVLTYRREKFALDSAFALIEAHPCFRNGKGKHGKPGHSPR